MKVEPSSSLKGFYSKWQWFCLFLATGFFTGLLPRSQKMRWLFKKETGGGGSMGVLLGFLAGVMFVCFQTSFGWICLSTAAVFWVSTIVIDPAEELTLEIFGPSYRHKGTVKVEWDFNSTNIDEILAVLAGSLSIHMSSANSGRKIIALVFLAVFFWVLDSTKPWKIRAVERYFTEKNLRTEAIIMDDLAVAIPVFITGLIIIAFI